MGGNHGLGRVRFGDATDFGSARAPPAGGSGTPEFCDLTSNCASGSYANEADTPLAIGDRGSTK